MHDVALTADEAGPQSMLADSQLDPPGSGPAAGLQAQLEPRTEPDTARQQGPGAQVSNEANIPPAAGGAADPVPGPPRQPVAEQDIDEEAQARAALARIRQAKSQARPSPSAGIRHSIVAVSEHLLL